MVLADQGFYLLGVGTLLSMVFSVEARSGIVPSPYSSSYVVFGETSGADPDLLRVSFSEYCYSLLTIALFENVVKDETL